MVTPTYSIVLPAYNESARIADTLNKILAYDTKRGWNAEIIVVNDGSSDGTARAVVRAGAKVMRHRSNRVAMEPPPSVTVT